MQISFQRLISAADQDEYECVPNLSETIQVTQRDTELTEGSPGNSPTCKCEDESNQNLQETCPVQPRDKEVNKGRQGEEHRGKGEEECDSTLDEPSRASRVTPSMLEKMVDHLLPSLESGDQFFVPAFLYLYRRFATTEQVLDLLFMRYQFCQLPCKEDDTVKRTICTFLEMWLDKYPEDFTKSPHLSALNQLMAYLLLHVPFSDLAVRVNLLLTEVKTPVSQSAVIPKASCESEDPELAGSSTSQY